MIRNRSPSTLILPLGVFLALTGAFVWLWSQANSRDHYVLAKETNWCVEQAGLRLRESGRTIDVVAREWGLGARSPSVMAAFAEEICATYEEVIAINWISPGMLLERVHPQSPLNESLLNRNVRQDPEVVADLEAARNTPDVVYSQPPSFYKGHASLAGYRRLDGTGSDGYLNVVISLDRLLGLLGDTILERFDYALCYRETDGTRVYFSPEEVQADDLRDRDLRDSWNFEMGDRQWELILAPKEKYLAQGASPEETAFLVIGAILALAIGLFVRRAQLAQAALTISESRYRSVVQDLPDWICRYKPDGTIEFVNDAFAQHFGHEASDLVGTSLYDLYPPEQHADLRARIAALDPDEPVETVRQSLPGTQGPERWEKWRERALTDDDHRIVEVQSFGHDATEAMLAERELRHSQERYRTLVESSPDGVLIQRDGRILFANDSVARLVGADGTWQLAGERVEDLVPSEDRELLSQRLAHVMGGSEMRMYDVRFKHARGHLVETEMIGTRITFDGQLAVQAILRDVTDRRRAERDLRNSEERFRAIFGSISDGVLIHDRSGALLDANESACALFGLERDVMLRLDAGALVADDDPRTIQGLRESYARARESGEPQIFEWRARRSGSEDWWAEVSLRAARIAGRERVLAVVRDVTERRDAQEELRAARNRLTHLLSTGPTVIYSRSPAPASELTFVSRNVAQLVGRDPDDLLGERARWRGAMHEGDRVRVDAELAQADARGDRFSSEYRLRTPDGDELWIQDDARLLRDDEGRPVEWVGSWRDVTERKQIESRQRLMMDELDHRVKNTLAMVLSLLEQTLAGVRSRSELRDAFRGRVEALARAHEALAQERWESVDLERIARLVLGPHVELGRISILGPTMPLDSHMASPLALALHELATNAAKHGALSVTTGHVDLAWTEDERGLSVTWTELGGPLTEAPTAGGTGLRLVRGLVEHEVGGKAIFDFLPAGLRVELRLPMAGRVPRPQLLA